MEWESGIIERGGVMDNNTIFEMATSIVNVQKVGYNEGYKAGDAAGYRRAMQEMKEILNKDKEGK